MPDVPRTVHIGAQFDQYQAAIRDTVATHRMMAAVLGGAVPVTVNAATARIIGRHATARPNLCRHLRPGAPRPMFAVAWRPGQVTCGRCAPRVLTCPPEQEHVCDGCGRDVPGRITVGTMTQGLLILHYGLCPTCVRATAAVR
jgi:hypothetical protein